jgi:hypothetical protein
MILKYGWLRRPTRHSECDPVAEQNLTPIERAEVLSLIRHTIATERFLRSPRIRRLKCALATMDPARIKLVEPYPPSMAWVNSSIDRKRRNP